MQGESPLTFREFMMDEPLPLGVIHDAVLDFLRGSDNAVLFGAQAVNAYVQEPRMTQDVDILSPRAAELASALREHLRERFHIAVRVREVSGGRGYRLFQLRKPANRHLVDIRSTPALPPTRRVAEVLVVTPEELIAGKVISFHRRRDRPKSGTDWRDLAAMLLRFPQLKSSRGPVRDRLLTAGADADTLAAWDEIVARRITPETDEDEFG